MNPGHVGPLQHSIGVPRLKVILEEYDTQQLVSCDRLFWGKQLLQFQIICTICCIVLQVISGAESDQLFHLDLSSFHRLTLASMANV